MWLRSAVAAGAFYAFFSARADAFDAGADPRGARGRSPFPPRLGPKNFLARPKNTHICKPPFACQNVLKLTYSNLEFQIFRGGPPYPRLQGEGREGEGRRGRGNGSKNWWWWWYIYISVSIDCIVRSDLDLNNDSVKSIFIELVSMHRPTVLVSVYRPPIPILMVLCMLSMTFCHY